MKITYVVRQSQQHPLCCSTAMGTFITHSQEAGVVTHAYREIPYLSHCLMGGGGWLPPLLPTFQGGLQWLYALLEVPFFSQKLKPEIQRPQNQGQAESEFWLSDFEIYKKENNFQGGDGQGCFT